MLDTTKTLTTLASEHIDIPITEKQVSRYLQMTATAIHMIVDDPDMWIPVAYYTLLDNTVSQYIQDKFHKRIFMINMDEMLRTLPDMPNSRPPEPSRDVKAIMLALAERFIFELRVTNYLVNTIKENPSDGSATVISKETFNSYINDSVTKMNLEFKENPSNG